MLMLSYCGTDVYYLMKNQMRVDATLRFNLKVYLEGNEGKTTFSFDIHLYVWKQTTVSYMFFQLLPLGANIIRACSCQLIVA